MQRRQFVKTTGLSMAMLALLKHKGLAQLLADPAWKMTLLRNDVGVFTERGGTIAWCVNKKGIIVVDTQFPEQAGHLIEELKKRSDKPFRLLVNTHHHGDHSGGNIRFKGMVQQVVAHANSLTNQKRVAVERKTEKDQLFPDTSFTDTWKKKIGKEKLAMHYFGPGHTNGDSIVHFENANIVHMGDLVFNRRYPFVDRSSGANIKSWVEVLDKTMQHFNKDTLFVFGHALDPEKITGNTEDLRAFRNFLSRLLDFTDKEIKAGKSKAEILKATAIPGAEEWKGDGIERGLGAAYDELTSK